MDDAYSLDNSSACCLHLTMAGRCNTAILWEQGCSVLACRRSRGRGGAFGWHAPHFARLPRPRHGRAERRPMPRAKAWASAPVSTRVAFACSMGLPALFPISAHPAHPPSHHMVLQKEQERFGLPRPGWLNMAGKLLKPSHNTSGKSRSILK